MLSPIAVSTLNKEYGALESLVALLTEGLIKRGIDVTLFATASSHTSAKLHAECLRSYEEDNSILEKVCECLHISEVFERANELDINTQSFRLSSSYIQCACQYTCCNYNTRSFFK